MNVGNIFSSSPQSQAISWVNAAKFRTIADITEILRDESQHDPNWFANGRKTRLKQLVDEIFSLKLIEVSDGQWSEQSFEGKQHSIRVSSALSDVLNKVTTIYQQLLIQHKINTK